MTTLNFNINALNISIDASMTTIEISETTPFICDVVAELSMFLSYAQNLFRFQSDAIDITNDIESDIKYKVEYIPGSYTNGVPELVMNSDLLFDCKCTGTDNNDPIYLAGTANATNNNITYEYMRYLATKIFNTHLAVDLFSNEQEVRDNLNATGKINLDNLLNSLASLNNGDYCDTNQIVVDDNGNLHPSYVILQQILKYKPERLAGKLDTFLIEGDQSGTEDGIPVPIFKMPFDVGDTIQLPLSINADIGQNTILDPLNPTPIPVRTYRIVFNIIPDNDV